MGKPKEFELREERGLWLVDIVSEQSKGPMAIGQAKPVTIVVAVWARDSEAALAGARLGAKENGIVVLGLGDVKHTGITESMVVDPEMMTGKLQTEN